MHRSNNNSRTNFSGEPATARASSSAAWAPLPPALAGHEREGKTDYQETNLTWCEKIEGHYGQFIYQIHEKEIEKRGNIHNGMKIKLHMFGIPFLRSRC